MFSIIAYVIHFYILPTKVYTGVNCIEEWTEGLRAWHTTFETAIVLDVIIGAICIAIELTKFFKTKNSDASSKTEG